MAKFTGPRRLPSTLTEKEAFESPSPRRTLCPIYEECLDYAISYFWASFTCRGCRMEQLIVLGKISEVLPPRGERCGTWADPALLYESRAQFLS